MKYHNITHEDMANGEGLRVVLWLSGCEHLCKGCHNPITWNKDDGIDFGEEAKEEIFESLRKEEIAGITFSGGDPLASYNRREVALFMEEIRNKFKGKTIWCYTGYCWEQVKDIKAMEYIDVLIDGKFNIDRKSPDKRWVGSDNQSLVDVKKSRKKNMKTLYKESKN